MKNTIYLSLLMIILLISGCTEEKPVIDRNAELAKIQAVLEKYIIAKEEQNFSLIEEVWADSEDIYLLGTDSDEKYIGWAQIESAIKRQFAEFQQMYISTIEQSVKLDDKCETAWFVEFLSYNFIHEGKAKQFEGIRFTGVLEKFDDNWKLVQGHMSIPVQEGTESEGN